MNKKGLASKVASAVKMKKYKVEQVIDEMLKVISETIKAGDKVRLVGFGNFVVRTRAGRVGRNPQTGEKIDISPSKSPAFVPGINLKNMVRG